MMDGLIAVFLSMLVLIPITSILLFGRPKRDTFYLSIDEDLLKPRRKNKPHDFVRYGINDVAAHQITFTTDLLKVMEEVTRKGAGWVTNVIEHTAAAYPDLYIKDLHCIHYRNLFVTQEAIYITQGKNAAKVAKIVEGGEKIKWATLFEGSCLSTDILCVLCALWKKREEDRAWVDTLSPDEFEELRSTLGVNSSVIDMTKQQ
jgi:hypothetical protein